MKKIVLFDAYGTLFKLDIESEQLDLLLGNDKARFLGLWREKLLEYSWLTSLMKNWMPFNSIILKALKHACEVYQVKWNDVAPVVMNLYENPSLYGDVLQTLEILKAENCTTCIMSNGEYQTLSNAVCSNSIVQLIDRIFSASEVEQFKVSPLVYRMATAHYNIGPSNMFFISSNPWDISGAQHFGYKTIWINREGKVFDTLVKGPNFQVQEMGEALEIIKSNSTNAVNL